MTREEGPTMFPSPSSMRPTLRGTSGLVVAGHPIAAQAASEVLARGGNAVDAGVAAGLVLAVVHSDMCSLGGIAPMLVREPSGNVWSIGGVGTWSETASIEAFVDRHGGEITPGCGAVVVPAALSAYCSALERFGSWSFEDVAQPAHEAALDGFVVDPVVAAGHELFGEVYQQWRSSVDAFWPEGRPPRVGEVLRQPDLASTLERLRDEGDARSAKERFHRGDIASAMVDFVRSNGGFLTLGDVADFEAEVAPAPTRRYRDQQVFSTPAWSQGPMMLQALAILSNVDVGAMNHNGADHLHLLTESIKLAASDREAFYGPGDDVPIEWLLSDARAAELARRFDPSSALVNLPTIRGEQLGTTHFTVIDADGTACSAAPSDTASLGPVVPGLGFVVSPRGVQSRLDPTHPAALGPRRRPRVTPAAVIAEGDDGTITALACPGADVIVQAMLQVASNVWDFDMALQEAVEAPRLCSLGFPSSFAPHTEIEGQLCVESRIPEAIRADLERRGHRVQDWPDWEFDAGSVSVVQRYPNRTLAAGADPRRAAYAAGR